MQLSRHGRRARGFTLIELMITVAVVALLSAVAMPAMRTMIANGKVRATSELVMGQLRQAQSEAVKRYRRVVLYRASTSNCSGGAPAANASGNVWVVATLPLYTGDSTEVVQCGNLGDTSSTVTFTSSPTAVCFGTNGWPIALPSGSGAGTTGLTVACTTTPLPTYSLSNSAGDRPLRVILALAGTVRMCDPAKTFSSSDPDGCP